MKFAEKKKAYQDLQDPYHLECDRELLRKKNPKSTALSTGIVNKAKAQCEILWALLDVATVEEITANRPAQLKELTKEEIKAIAEQTGKLAAQIYKVNSLQEKEDIILQIKVLTEPLPEAVAEAMLKLPLSIVPDFVKVNEATEQLIALNLESATQSELASIARTLKLTTPDFKAATLRPILKDIKDLKLLSLQPHSDQVIDQMNAEKEALTEKVEDLQAEKEDLEEQLEDAETQKEELVEQLEDIEAEKELLEEQLEEEKKSEASTDQP